MLPINSLNEAFCVNNPTFDFSAVWMEVLKVHALYVGCDIVH